MSSQAELRHLDRLSQMGCIMCLHLELGQTPPEVHHLRTGAGMAQRAPHWLAVPLCAEHHRGPSGLHGLGTRGFTARYNLTELDLLAMTISRLFGGR